MQKPKKKLLDIVRDKIRVKHYIFFHNEKHPIEMGKEEIEQFLTFLAVQKKVYPFLILLFIQETLYAL